MVQTTAGMCESVFFVVNALLPPVLAYECAHHGITWMGSVAMDGGATIRG